MWDRQNGSPVAPCRYWYARTGKTSSRLTGGETLGTIATKVAGATPKSREVADRTEDHFTVGLVGYTNAGKSTLFNRLTDGGAFADMLFATCPRVDAWPLGGGVQVLVSDTVGFVRDLPHRLVASFRGLEGNHSSSLILQVLDASDPHAVMQLETTEHLG